MKTISIAKDFTRTPGARYIEDGPYSGQEFREKFLERIFQDPQSNEKVTIVFDGTIGYPTSFLEEAFGGLARKFGAEKCIEKLEFISNDDPLLIEEIKMYISKASNNEK